MTLALPIDFDFKERISRLGILKIIENYRIKEYDPTERIIICYWNDAISQKSQASEKLTQIAGLSMHICVHMNMANRYEE